MVFTGELVLQYRHPWWGTFLGQGALSLGALVVLLLVARSWRKVTLAAELSIWRWMLLGVGLIGAAVLVAGVFNVLDEVSGSGNMVFNAGCLLACGAFYQSLVRWNRAQTLTSDPGDWLSGLSSVIILASIGYLLVEARNDRVGILPPGSVQLDVVLCSAVFVVLCTAVAASTVGDLRQDVRIRLVAGAMATVAAGEVLVLVLPDGARPVQQTAWLLAAAGIALCAKVAPPADEPRPATNPAAIIGSLVVLVGGLAVVTVNTGLFFSVDHVVTALAAIGTLGTAVRIIRLVQDLTQLTKTRYEARTDELTGLSNRRALLEAIDRMLGSGAATLLIVDLDKFKIVNDRYGHATGDLVLRNVAAAFATIVPPNALLARLGGDEFAVLISDEPIDTATILARSLAAALLPITEVNGRSVEVVASVGVSRMPAGADGSILLHQADAAMYQAKLSGADVCVYDGNLAAEAQERQALIDDLHLTLNDGTGAGEQIVVYYQPQLEIATRRVVGAEALVRWMHPRLGLLAPDQFIDLVEQSGLMNHLTARVLAQSAEQAQRWLAAGHPLRLSVNLSASSLSDSDTLAVVDHILRWGLAPERLVLEVTETSMMVDPVQSLTAMRLITERGVAVSIDDYGTGYSSLSYLNDLPAKELKIDQTFVARISRNPKTAAIVAATVALAHQLGLRLVAEGVEDEATFQMLAGMGCDESQGYLHSKPLDSEMFMAWLIAYPGAGPVPAPRSSAGLSLLPSRAAGPV